MFGTGLRKILGFFVPAGRAKALAALPCSAALSQKRVRCWGGKEGKKRFQGRRRVWVASRCAKNSSLALFAFSAAPHLETLASPRSFSRCLCIPGHRFPCTTHRWEAGGSFLPIPEVSAAVTENGNNSTGFPLLFILPLNSVQPPQFPCAT